MTDVTMGGAQEPAALSAADEQLLRELTERARAGGLKLTGVEDMVISLSAKGLTHGEIAAHLAEVYGAEVSKQTITAITDRVMDGMTEWQNRPLDPVYAVVFIDAIQVKIREGQVATRPL